MKYEMFTMRLKNDKVDLPDDAIPIGYEDVPPSGNGPDSNSYHREIIYLKKEKTS